jgi:hypothetical protein
VFSSDIGRKVKSVMYYNCGNIGVKK